jgi:hypothetical protein
MSIVGAKIAKICETRKGRGRKVENRKCKVQRGKWKVGRGKLFSLNSFDSVWGV